MPGAHGFTGQRGDHVTSENRARTHSVHPRALQPDIPARAHIPRGKYLGMRHAAVRGLDENEALLIESHPGPLQPARGAYAGGRNYTVGWELFSIGKQHAVFRTDGHRIMNANPAMHRHASDPPGSRCRVLAQHACLGRNEVDGCIETSLGECMAGGERDFNAPGTATHDDEAQAPACLSLTNGLLPVTNETIERSNGNEAIPTRLQPGEIRLTADVK